MAEHVTGRKLAWGLADIASQTGLSIGFLRNEVRAKRLLTRKFGRRILVLDEDLHRYLSKEREPDASDLDLNDA